MTVMWIRHLNSNTGFIAGWQPWAHNPRILTSRKRLWSSPSVASQWRHNVHPDVSNHQWLDCFFNRWFRLASKKTSEPALLTFCEENPQVTGGFLHKGPVRRKPLPFDDVIMWNNPWTPADTDLGCLICSRNHVTWIKWRKIMFTTLKHVGDFNSCYITVSVVRYATFIEKLTCT